MKRKFYFFKYKMTDLFPCKKDVGKKKEQLIPVIARRMRTLLAEPFGKETKIQCSWPIYESDVYAIYNTISIGLSLVPILDFNGKTEKRLTESAKKKLDDIESDNRCYGINWGSMIKPSAGMTKEVFSKEESYYRKPIKYVQCRNILSALRPHLQVHINPHCVTIILSY